jgi:hypothetical protein
MAYTSLLYSYFIALVETPAIYQLYELLERQFRIPEQTVKADGLFVSFGTLENVAIPILLVNP